jgi:hypothetical protein
LDIRHSCLPAGRGIYLELACLPQAGNLVIGYLKRFYSQEV